MLTDAELLRAVAVGGNTQLGLIEYLPDAQVDESRHVTQGGDQSVGDVVILRARARDLNVDGRGSPEIQNLAYDIRRQKPEHGAGKLTRQAQAQLANVVRSARM